MSIPASNEAASNASAAEPPSLRRRLFSNAFWLLGGRIASMGSAFAANVILARWLSTDDFSAYAIAMATVNLLAMPASFGAPRVVLRLIREAIVARAPQRAFESLRQCIKLVGIVSAIIAVSLFIGVHWLGPAPKWAGVREYPVLIGVWIGLSAICMCLAHALQGFDRFYTSALVGARNGGIITNLPLVLALSAGALVGRLSLHVAISAQVILYCAALAYGWYVLWTIKSRTTLASGGDHADHAQNSPAKPTSLLAECWPVLVIQLTSTGVAQVDMLMVAWLTNERQIAAYGAVARLCEMLAAGQIMAAAIAAPFVSELYATNQMEKLEKMLRGIASFSAAPTLLMGAVMLIAPATVLEHTFGPNFVNGALALQFGVIGCCISGLAGANSLTMIMAGRQRTLMRISAMAGVAYLCLSPWMIITWGIAGAALSSTIIFGGYNVLVTLMIKSQMGIWTVATLSPSVYVATFRQILRKRTAPRIKP